MRIFRTDVVDKNQNTHSMFNNFLPKIIPCIR